MLINGAALNKDTLNGSSGTASVPATAYPAGVVLSLFVLGGVIAINSAEAYPAAPPVPTPVVGEVTTAIGPTVMVEAPPPPSWTVGGVWVTAGANVYPEAPPVPTWTVGGLTATFPAAAPPLDIRAMVVTIADATAAADGVVGVGLAPTNALVTMFELDATALGGTVYRFHAGLNGVMSDLVWQGNTYTAFPIIADGFEQKASGGLPRPTLRTSNVNGTIGALIASYRDLVGAKVTRKRTLLMYLDAVNFAGGNATANPAAYFPDDVYLIDRKAKMNAQMIEFELAAASDCHGVLVPNRAIIANTCMWAYKGTECGYAGGAVATWGDVPTADPTLDSCGKRLSSCKLRFGANAALPFGGFPAAQRG